MIFLFISLLFIVVNAQNGIDKQRDLSSNSSPSPSPFELVTVANASSTSYVCSANRSQITFTLLNGSHSAKDSTGNCRLPPCPEHSDINIDCRTSRTPCFEYQHVNGTNYCAPAVQCSILAPCEEVTNRCTSTRSICVMNSCCTPNHVCLPISLINICPSTRTIQSSTTSILNTVSSDRPITSSSTTCSTSINSKILLLTALVMALTPLLCNWNK